MKKKKIIIITGALGQDGLILSKIYINNNFKVIGIVKKLTNNAIKKVQYTKIPLDKFSIFSKTIKKINPDIFIHLGTDNPNLKESRNRYPFKKNYGIVKNIIDFFYKNKKKTKVILIGTSQMYSKKEDTINIETKFNPQNLYGEFRVKSFDYMKKNKSKYNLHATMAILFNHDSVFRNKKFLLPRITKLIKDNKFKMLQEIFNENISGDFSHAEDICNGIYKLSIKKSNPDKLIFSSNKRVFINNIIDYLMLKNNKKFKFTKTKKKNFTNPIGDNTFTKKIIKWKIKKNSFIAAQELI